VHFGDGPQSIAADMRFQNALDRTQISARVRIESNRYADYLTA
jgi:hypothetical protein